MPDCDAIYRRINNPPGPACPYRRPCELRDIWPKLQEDFKRTVDAIYDDKETQSYSQIEGKEIRWNCSHHRLKRLR